MTTSVPTPGRRCAIYTRKSTAVGVEEDFSSLDAQRAACESFIRSQPGWEPTGETYDDGGFTGANIDRPAFTRLLADIDAGKVDIVVYKVDRLSRSLLDFAKLMGRFTKAKAAFVSVTQNFSTADAMGRLTLNVLMSFAEFEREMIAERTRDKIAASRRRGKWTGGPVPLGFILCGGKLVVDEHEALTVREIFATYLEHRSLVRIIRALTERGRTTKLHESRTGNIRRRRPWTKDAILRVLRNPLYAGLTQSEGSLFPGEHQAIISADDFRRVQLLLGRPREGGFRIVVPGYVLRGLVYCDACGKLMTPASTRRGDREYRYYRCPKPDKDSSTACGGAFLPAKEIEDFVIEHLRYSLGDRELISEVAGATRERALCVAKVHVDEKKLLVAKIAEVSSRVSKLALQIEQPDGGSAHARELLRARVERHGEQLASLQRRLDRVERELRVVDDARIEGTWVERELVRFDDLWRALTSENRGRLVRAIVEHVVVDPRTGAVKMHVADLASAPQPDAKETA